MLQKNVQLIRIQTLADNTGRLVIDLLNTKSDDLKQAYDLHGEDTTMILCRTAELPDVIQEVANQLIAAANG